jgi:hypothetical protein
VCRLARSRPGQRCPAALDCAVSVRGLPRFPPKRCRTDRAASASSDAAATGASRSPWRRPQKRATGRPRVGYRDDDALGFGLIGCLAGPVPRLCITHLQASLRRGFFCTEIGTILEFCSKGDSFFRHPASHELSDLAAKQYGRICRSQPGAARASFLSKNSQTRNWTGRARPSVLQRVSVEAFDCVTQPIRP